MKNKEEPSLDLTRGNPSRQPAGKFPGSLRVKTTGSTVRPDDAASASTIDKQMAASDCSAFQTCSIVLFNSPSFKS